MKEVARYYDPEEAQIAAGFLRAQGLTVHLADVHSLSAMPDMRFGLGGYRLLADGRDASLAQRYLADIAHEQSERGESCPNCGSRRLTPERDPSLPLVHALLGYLFPFAKRTGRTTCADCNYTWRRD